MIKNLRQKSTLQSLAAKQEGVGVEAEATTTTITTATLATLKGSSSSTSSRQWSSAGFRNPRIVRVSRTFGGKDRHSKVCTVRGLRDRRIRLSVPTAVQLYDLQERLGLSQPSKVIDWLIEATKSDIDKLPPLQIPQGFGQFHQQLLFPNLDQQNINPISSFASFFDGNNNQENYQTVSMKEKEKVSEKANEDQIFAQKFFPISNNNQSSLSTPGMMNNNGMGYNFYHSLEPSNLSLSQFGSHGFAPQIETNANNPLSFSSSSSSSFPSGSHQLFFYPPPPTTPSVFAPFPPLESTTTTTTTSSQHFLQNSLFPSHQLLHSSSSNSKPSPFPSFFNHPKFFSRGSNEESKPGQDHTAGS